MKLQNCLKVSPAEPVVPDEPVKKENLSNYIFYPPAADQRAQTANAELFI
jgi:hypothetical protein